MIKSIKADRLLGQQGVRHAFYMRTGGVSKGSYESLNCSLTSDDDFKNIIENRKLVAEDFGVEPAKLVTCKQIHSADVMVVEEPWTIEESPEADALVTKTRGIALGALSADCVPVLFADSKAGVVAAAHAGRRGAVAGIISEVVDAMVTLGAEKENIVAAMGPAIMQDSYEVDLNTMVCITEHDVNHRRFFVEGDNENSYMFDLPGFVRNAVIATGVSECSLSHMDTYANEAELFSYRRNQHNDAGPHGGQVSVIMLE